jgi:hypothetical protein
VSLHRSFDGGEPARPESGRLAGTQEERRVLRSSHMAVGTLACPRCDAPVMPGPVALRPADPLGCPYCAHSGAVRDFLSLAPPSRPARVAVRVVERI